MERPRVFSKPSGGRRVNVDGGHLPRKQLSRKDSNNNNNSNNSQRQQKGRKLSRNPNVVAASEIAAEFMPRFGSTLVAENSAAQSRVDEGPVELIDEVGLVRRPEERPASPPPPPPPSSEEKSATITSASTASQSSGDAEKVEKPNAVEGLNGPIRRRRVIKLYVPRNGKFSNGLEKRSGLLLASNTDA